LLEKGEILFIPEETSSVCHPPVCNYKIFGKKLRLWDADRSVTGTLAPRLYIATKLKR
jgi:hypothetical protein